jgi:ABC-type Fe3+/spermidine/putrescine transport system ATPase subunit
VTHDQEETLILADRIAIMCEGQVHQIRTRDGLRAPRYRYVAGFLGRVFPRRRPRRKERDIEPHAPTTPFVESGFAANGKPVYRSLVNGYAPVAHPSTGSRRPGHGRCR